MSSHMRTLLHEPLLHFFVAAIGLFLLFDLVSDPDEIQDDQIVVSSGQIERLASLFMKTQQRQPSDDELRGLIDDFVIEEVMYREAVAIGLDRDDTIIRRRLRQKMEFLLDDFVATTPTDSNLQQFLDDNPDRFRSEARISFAQIFLERSSRDNAGPMLAKLRENEVANSIDLSESHLIPHEFHDVRESAVSARLGSEFSTALFALDVGQWTGPVDSPFGIHLIKIEGIVAGRVPALSEIRKDVEREWLFDSRSAMQQQVLDEMKGKYTITIDSFDAGK